MFLYLERSRRPDSIETKITVKTDRTLLRNLSMEGFESRTLRVAPTVIFCHSLKYDEAVLVVISKTNILFQNWRMAS